MAVDSLSPRERALRRLLTDVGLFSRHVVGVPLRSYQLEPARAIVDSVLRRRGLTFTIMMSRQAGKNELSAQLETFLLTLYQRRGGSIVKAAPTFRPQLLNSIMRLERSLDNELTRGQWRTQYGAVVQLGRARAFFFSGDPESQVVGATASLLLEIDEAQDFDEEKYLRDFRPMGATANVTTVLYGTAWTADTLLERARRENLRLEAQDGVRRDFRYPWDAVAAHNPDYRAYVTAEMARMGSEHPLIRTQYLLEAIESGGRFLSETQLAQLRGDHPRLTRPGQQAERGAGGSPQPSLPPGEGVIGGPVPSLPSDSSGLRPHPRPLPEGEGISTFPPDSVFVAGIDVAGEDEVAENAALRSLKPRKDSTAVTICAVTWAPVEAAGAGATELARRTPTEPRLRIVQHYWWTGRTHRELFPQLVDLLRNVWHCRAVVVDATGVGAGVASFLVGALPGVVRPFVFTAGSKSALGYGLLTAINAGRLKMYAEDGSPESGELWQEARLARSALHENQRLSFYVDPREGHDDLLISAALAVEAAAGAEPRVALGRRVEVER